MQDVKTMKSIEDKILMQISESATTILVTWLIQDNDKLINTLDESSVMSNQINERMAIAEKT